MLAAGVKTSINCHLSPMPHTVTYQWNLNDEDITNSSKTTQRILEFGVRKWFTILTSTKGEHD